MSKAFLSHASQQKPLIEIICNKLGRDNCVMDKYNFQIGTPTLDSIIAGIEKTDLFVLFLSDEALNSKWVQDEIVLAKNLKDLSDRVIVFLIDETIDHNDHRIPAWLTAKYNLRVITDPVLLYKKIDSKLRDISIENHPYIKKKEEIFVGRNDLMDEFEKKYYNLQNIKPTAIIASGFEEIGRRKFVKQALDKVEKLNKYHEPISIFLDSRDSIEDFILRVEDLHSVPVEDVLERIKNEDLNEKINYAIHLVKKFRDTNEILFIIDNGSIVQHSKELSNWFLKIINSEEFKNNTVICLISKFRPIPNVIQQLSSLIAFHVIELTPSDRQLLFLKYCELFQLNPSREQIESILSVLNGMPSQIYHCAKMINDEGIDKTMTRLEDIKKLNDIKVYKIIDAIRNQGDLFFNVLVLISRFEFISYDFIYRIFYRSTDLENVLDTLFIYGVYDRIGVNKEYIQVHHAVSDYVKRAKFPLEDSVRIKLNKEIKSLLNGENDYPDVSQLLITVKSFIDTGKMIPEKYFIPSFVLRVILGNYYEGNYSQVNVLAVKVLNNYLKYDDYIVREVRYWYCMSLSRQSKEEFFNQVKEIHGPDHSFLVGFYKRIQRKYSEAEGYFREVLYRDSNSQKARRELVNVLMSQSRYSEALQFAEVNYEKHPLNAFHIQGYFQCLVRKKSLTYSEKDILKELMNNIKISHDAKAQEIYMTMLGEYEFYVNKNLPSAIKLLKKAIDQSTYKHYPKKALVEIYSKSHLKAEEAKLKKEIEQSKNQLIDDFDFFLKQN